MYQGNKILVMAGAYNEEGKIGEVVRRTPWNIVDEFLVVDDGSTDNTGKEAREAGATVLRNNIKSGPGYLTRRVMKYALKNNYDIIVAIAGDAQDNPQEIPKLLGPLIRGYDLVQGSRYLKKGNKIPLFRKVTTKLFTYAFRLVTGYPITDAANGFRAYKIKIAQEINFSHEWLDGYEFEPYMLIQAIKKGYKIKEVPVSKYYPQEKGYSKMRPFFDWYRICKPLIRELIGR